MPCRGISIDYGGTLTSPYIDAQLGQKPICPRAAATLRLLHDLGLRFALGSNTKPGQCRRRALRAAGVEELFDAVIESEQAGIRKPDPTFYRLVEDALGLPAAEIAAVGNNLLNDVSAPLDYGFGAAFLIRSGGVLRQGEMLPPGACVIDSIGRLPSLFRGSQ